MTFSYDGADEYARQRHTFQMIMLLWKRHDSLRTNKWRLYVFHKFLYKQFDARKYAVVLNLWVYRKKKEVS